MPLTIAQIEHATANALEQIRQTLIDVGKSHNALTNFSPRTLSVDAFGPTADDVFARLVDENKAIRFSTAKPEASEDMLTTSADVSVLSPDDPTTTSPHLLITELRQDDLATKLRRIAYESRSQTQEFGYSSLYLALGFLTYFEPNAGERPVRAPLLLLPVELTVNKRGAYSLRYNGADIGPNIALRESLATGIGIDLPEPIDGNSPSQLFDDVEQAVSGQTGWSVDGTKFHLGFFSFASFLMYNDLDPKSWPEGSQPAMHPVLQRLLSDVSGHQAAELDWGCEDLAQGWPEQLIPLILDADSSQVNAINRVSKGSDFVIDGPPGTGKSQTIANLIARAVSEGKRVIFVADKLVALEVVKNRLDDAGLGQVVLELHSHKGNKVQVIDQLKAATKLPPAQEPEWDQVKPEYLRLAGRLNDYAKALEDTILDSKLNFIEVAAKLHELDKRLHNVPGSDYQVPEIEKLSRNQLDLGFEQLRALSTQRDLVGVPRESPFKMFHHVTLSPTDLAQASSKFASAHKLISSIDRDARSIASKLGVQRPSTLEDLMHLDAIASRAISAPPNIGRTIGDRDWSDLHHEIAETVSAGSELRDIAGRRGGQVPDDAWATDLNHERVVWQSKGRNWFKRWSKDYRKAHTRLAEALGSDVVDDYDECLAVLKDISTRQLLTKRLTHLVPLVTHLFRDGLRVDNADWDEIRHIAEWVQAVRTDVDCGALPRVALKWTKSGRELTFDGGNLADIRTRVQALKASIKEATSLLRADVPTKLSGPIDTADLSELARSLDRLRSLDFQQLAQFKEFVLRKRVFSDGPLGGATQLVESHDYSFHAVKPIIDRAWLRGLFNHARYHEPPLTNFQARSHEFDRNMFARKDAALRETARQHAISIHQGSMPELVPAGQTGILLKEFNKKKQHLPIRRLIDSAGLAIQKIKPVFMMSPMSVAKFLKPGSIEFDLLIFDEASQVRISDAIGAILRSKQVVVVGDDKQLPPMSFFQKMAAMDDGDPEDDEDQEEAVATGMESILDLFKSRNTAFERLRWHYRSRHEGLIAFSNREFYDTELVTFPSSGDDPYATGVKFVHGPEHRYIPGHRKSVNPGEARSVAQRVIQHAEANPGQTLGVVAFSVSQRNRILDELEPLRRSRPDLDSFFQQGGPEPFFVKNLENVQGDERDVILISVGYGMREDDRLSRNFGPVNRQGGERRLNVLVTRAKNALEVFCNFTSDDLEVSDSEDNKSPYGVVALHEFLAFAENPYRRLPTTSGDGPESEFEEQVAEVVRKLGYRVETQLGQSDYRIDIAVRDRTQPGRFLLAIECDGAMYHSSVSARDRDRLRQQVLESLGWRIHRIWSTEWFGSSDQRRRSMLAGAIRSAEAATSNRDDASGGSTRRHESAVNDIRTSQHRPEQEVVGTSERSPGDEDAPESLNTQSQWQFQRRSYERVEVSMPANTLLPWYQTGHARLALPKVVESEGPVHVNIAFRRLTHELKTKRTKKSVQLLRNLAASLHIDIRSDFLYPSHDYNPYPRDRSDFDQSDKILQWVPPEEIEEAILVVVRSAVQPDHDEAMKHAYYLLGFKKLTKNAREHMSRALQSLIDSGRVASHDGILEIPTSDA